MAWGYGTASDTTVRELATIPLAGSALQVRISNLFGNRPLVIGQATIGLSAGAASVVPGSLRSLSFGGSAGTTIAPGATSLSDPLTFAVSPGQTLAVSVFVVDTDLMTIHPCCSGPLISYFGANGAGNLTTAPGAALHFSSAWARLVDAVDVLSVAPGSIVVLGDSISDGFNSTVRWPDLLQQRIDRLAGGNHPAVVDEAITADTLTTVSGDDETKGGGPTGLARLASDVLDQPGVADVVIFLGTNDLYFGAPASQVIAGLTQAAAAVRADGIRVFAVTLLPRSTSPRELWTAVQQEALQQVDDWITSSSAFDGVIDLAAAVADVYDGACQPSAIFPPFDSGDHLHPNAAGDTAMADTVDTTRFDGLPQAPRLPLGVNLVPTARCSTPGPGFPP
ncbi:MAG: GDSL-type esterase/lipase family protein [Acidimicrobiales bacterium]